MRALLITCAAAAFTVAAAGCSSGAAGPASQPFNPFGTESPAAVGAEPVVSGQDAPPRGGGQTPAELCSTVCAKVAAVCPGAAGSDCVPACTATVTDNPTCAGEVEAYFSCIGSSSIVCEGQNISAPACSAALSAANTCITQ
jgi:hypothetical protein